jgi:hypothetical protein
VAAVLYLALVDEDARLFVIPWIKRKRYDYEKPLKSFLGSK